MLINTILSAPLDNVVTVIDVIRILFGAADAADCAYLLVCYDTEVLSDTPCELTGMLISLSQSLSLSLPLAEILSRRHRTLAGTPMAPRWLLEISAV